MNPSRVSPRINLTVQPDIWQRMQAVSGVNWSEVAREAFAAKLAELDERAGLTSAKVRARYLKAQALKLQAAVQRFTDDALAVSNSK